MDALSPYRDSRREFFPCVVSKSAVLRHLATGAPSHRERWKERLLGNTAQRFAKSASAAL